MNAGFGGRLRLQREKQQVALATIAAQTKIKQSLLEGLERDDVSHWPEGIFRRSYVRDYARAIGLEPESVVREFLTLYPDPSEVAAAESALEAQAAASGRFRRLVTSAVPALRQRPQDRELTIAATPASPSMSATPKLSLSAVADLCTRLARVSDRCEVPPLLEEAARILDAAGLILWSWNPRLNVLMPLLAHGYSDTMLAQMGRVRPDTDNAVAQAFRSAGACVVRHDGSSGAIVVPLMAPGGCVGVLALELRQQDEERESIRAVAAILAAQLVALFESAPMAEAVSA